LQSVWREQSGSGTATDDGGDGTEPEASRIILSDTNPIDISAFEPLCAIKRSVLVNVMVGTIGGISRGEAGNGGAVKSGTLLLAFSAASNEEKRYSASFWVN
jgi:hypothetical protein